MTTTLTKRILSSFKHRYHLFLPVLGQVRPLNTPGSEGDGGIAEWQDLFAEQARLSTNHTTVVVKGANHIPPVDRREYAMLTGAATIRVIEAARSNQPLQ